MPEPDRDAGDGERRVGWATPQPLNRQLFDGHWLDRRPLHPVRCLHFGVHGPAVADPQRAFAVDWAFTSGEQLHGVPWFAPSAVRGPVLARGIPDGPDADIDNMPQVLLSAGGSALASAHRLPYFLPDETLIAALKVTARRGSGHRLNFEYNLE